MSETGVDCCVNCEMIRRSFGSQNYSEKSELIKIRRSTPELPQLCAEQKNIIDWRFSGENHVRYQWISVLDTGYLPFCLLWGFPKRLSSSTYSPAPSSTTAAPKTQLTREKENVHGLSSNCLNVPNTAVGPGASPQGEYKVPEYFCYNKISYFEAEIEMLKYRCPQPSNKI